MMASWKLAPALATGNSVVLKPAEQSPLTALRLAELASEAGIPDGVLQVVPGFGETAGQALGRHPDVDMIAFTGSTEVGKLFLRYSGESNMKRVALECGGKSPHIVTKECGDLDAAATAVAWGVFYNQGEVCNAGSRLLVHEAVKDELLEKVVAVAERIRPGDPLDPKTRMGAIVDETQLGRVLGYIEAGKDEGAGLQLGGARVREDTGGYYVEPTIFDAVSNDMTIAREEIFGPVLSALSFSELDDAIAVANDTIYGLSAGIWTDDVNVAHRAARAIKAGIVWVNTFDAGDISSPFGGFKQSGFGRDKSIHALDKFTDLKAIWIALAGLVPQRESAVPTRRAAQRPRRARGSRGSGPRNCRARPRRSSRPNTAPGVRRAGAASSSPGRRTGGRRPAACRRTPRVRGARAAAPNGSRRKSWSSPAQITRAPPSARASAACTIPGSKNCTSSIPTTSDERARATSSAQPSTGTADMRTPAWLTTSAAS